MHFLERKFKFGRNNLFKQTIAMLIILLYFKNTFSRNLKLLHTYIILL